MCFSVTTFIVFNKLLMNYPELTYLAIPGTSSIKHGSYQAFYALGTTRIRYGEDPLVTMSYNNGNERACIGLKSPTLQYV